MRLAAPGIAAVALLLAGCTGSWRAKPRAGAVCACHCIGRLEAPFPPEAVEAAREALRREVGEPPDTLIGAWPEEPILPYGVDIVQLTLEEERYRAHGVWAWLGRAPHRRICGTATPAQHARLAHVLATLHAQRARFVAAPHLRDWSYIHDAGVPPVWWRVRG